MLGYTAGTEKKMYIHNVNYKFLIREIQNSKISTKKLDIDLNTV